MFGCFDTKERTMDFGPEKGEAFRVFAADEACWTLLDPQVGRLLSLLANYRVRRMSRLLGKF